MTAWWAEATGPAPAVQLAVTGELDLGTAGRLRLVARAALSGRTGTTLSIDMAQVTFIDAAGVGALIAISNDAQAGGNIIAITRPSRCVVRILELTARMVNAEVG
jgi:anti-anti-sigma factor